MASPEAGLIPSVNDKLPKSVEAPLTITLAGTNVVITTRLPSGAFPAETKLKFYPLKNHVLDSFAESTATVSGDQVSITAAKHESLTTAPSEFSGLLIAETASGNTGFYVSTAGTAPAKTVAAP